MAPQCLSRRCYAQSWENSSALIQSIAPLFTFENITCAVSGKRLRCVQLSSLRCRFGLMLPQVAVTWLRRTSCSFHSCFLLESAGCSVVRVKQGWRGCGCSVDMKGLLWPRPALLQNADPLFRPTHDSHRHWVFWTQQGGGIGGSIYTRCFNWLLLDWFSLWRPFRMALVHLCQSLNAWKPSLWSSGAGSKTLFP